MAEPLPKIGQRLGEIHRKLTGMDIHRPHQNPDSQNRKVL